MALIQKIYVSAASVPFSVADLDALLAKARTFNQTIGISGLLLYHNGSFLQILEGEEAAVDHLYAVIEKDRRHQRLQLVYHGEISERNFGIWNMGFFRPLHAAEVPGFIDILRARTTSPLELRGDPKRVEKLVNAFKDGLWRQKVAA